MKLVVLELKNQLLYQEITCLKTQQVAYIRPHLYKHNAPSGSITLVVKNTSDSVLYTSDALTITDISTANYFHGYVRFAIPFVMIKDTTYRIYINSSGYTYNDSAFIGWCNDFDLHKYNLNYTPVCSTDRPLDLEVWNKERIL
jgi:hypothetical protein